jgi:hypothetical protein
MSLNIKTENVRTFTFMEPGIHENVELTEVKYGISEKGNEYLAFYFKNDNNEQLSHTEWKPSDSEQERIVNQMRRVKHIVTKFVPESEYVFNANSFKEFAENTIRILGNKNKGKKIRIKVTYSNTGFTDLPNYVPFIESMDIPKEKSQLKISSIDKVTKDISTSTTATNSKNPFVTETKTSDLPF